MIESGDVRNWTNNTIAMFSYSKRPLLAFEQFDFLLQVLGQEADPGVLSGCDT